MKVKLNQTPIKETQIYQIYRAQNEKKQKFFVQIFYKKALNTLGIDQNIEHNITSLQRGMNQSIFSQNFLNIYSSSQNDQCRKIMSEQYGQDLSQYLINNQLNEKEALQIFSQVFKAIYSLILMGIKPVNVRPQHFVKVKNKWKIRSIVMNADISKTKGFESEYIWNPTYQAPQQYINSGKQQLQDQDLKLVVWNLGSILLDLLTTKHVLKNQEIIKKFQNKQFDFNLVKGKRSEKISAQTKKIISQMLHYNPKQRPEMQKLFQNQKLSHQVCQNFLTIADGNSEVSPQQLQLKMTQKLSESVKGSLLKSKTNPNKVVQKQEDQPKDFKKKLQKINEQENENASYIQKKETQIEEDDLFLSNLNLVSNQIQKKHVTFSKSIIKNEIANNYQSQVFPKQESFFQSQKYRKIFQIYKTYLDRSELLFVTSHKFNQIPFQNESDQIILLSKYAVYFVGLMNLNGILNSINHNKNIYNIQNPLFSQFIESIQYKSFKVYVGSIFQKKNTIFQRLKLEIEDFDEKKRNLLKTKQINQFVFDSNFSQKQFAQIKVSYRKILKKSYDCITKKYNLQRQQMIGRLGMYVVCCMTVDKLYQENDIEKNFTFFFQWAKKPSGKYVNLAVFQKYLDQANVSILVKHARYILQTYFNV